MDRKVNYKNLVRREFSTKRLSKAFFDQNKLIGLKTKNYWFKIIFQN